MKQSKLERKLLQQYSQIIGIDEVGRGAWAGPLVIGAYCLDAEQAIYPEVNDSKLMRAAQRKTYSNLLSQNEHILLEASNSEIDKFGLAKSLHTLIEKAMQRWPDAYFLIDGKFATDFGPNSIQVIKGDTLHYSIACASIVAKVYRDDLMKCFATKYPDYGFEKHVGYGTKLHRMTMQKLGVTDIHRLSYKPVKQIYEQFIPQNSRP